MEEDFETLAEQCVFYAGPSVIEARAMIMSHNDNLLRYDWEDNCVMPSSKQDEKNATSATITALDRSYELVPNIFVGSRSASIALANGEIGSLKIYGIDGRLIANYQLTEGANAIDLTNVGKAKGIYIYKVFINGSLEKTDKLVIVE